MAELMRDMIHGDSVVLGIKMLAQLSRQGAVVGGDFPFRRVIENVGNNHLPGSIDREKRLFASRLIEADAAFLGETSLHRIKFFGMKFATAGRISIGIAADLAQEHSFIDTNYSSFTKETVLE
jgi:hypothetical protein